MKLLNLIEEYRDKSQTYFRFTYKGKGPFAFTSKGPSTDRILKRFKKIGLRVPTEIFDILGKHGGGEFYFTSYGYKKVKNYMRHYQVIRKKIPDSMIIYRDKFQIMVAYSKNHLKEIGWPDIKDKEYKRKIEDVKNKKRRMAQKEIRNMSDYELEYFYTKSKGLFPDLIDAEVERRKLMF